MGPEAAFARTGIDQGQYEAQHRNITTSRGDWIFPEDRFLDICAFRLSETEHNPDGDMASTAINISTMSLINTTDNFEEYGIYRVFDRTLSLGDEIFLTGVFVNRVGSKRNIPVIRIGNIAAMPEEPYEIFSPRHRVYLIETRSLGGLSGSPVFLHLYPDRPRGDPITMGYAQATPSGGFLQDGDTVVMPYVLIGMVWVRVSDNTLPILKIRPRETQSSILDSASYSRSSK